MKHIILLFILSLSTSLFACGGCVDAPAAQTGANTIISNFKTDDTTLAEAFEEQIKLVNETLAGETKNQKEYNTLLNFEIDSVVNLKQLDFLKNIETSIRSVK